ncbi:TetR/AcrR family transcriptional regulator [Thalassobellus suaedae]|uniref:TetR/AcrR family transcriptional regulator n=1 Tax=Thalassobellus suaedae TaxID=3074124 RepID=A0ABY9XRQ4_9FLAO|nr:TetR/AcrR family transcriptional regulator [Flavobacteriaceae bacterium HL-DH14]
MGSVSLNSGRKVQKQKTRLKILNTTQELLKQNQNLSLEDVANASNISRATIYRYFSNIDLLCSEASLAILTNSTENTFLESQHLPIIDRILYIQDYFNELALNNEAAFRKYLSIYLKEDNSYKTQISRSSRRMAALKLALIPYRNQIDRDVYNKLLSVSTALMGIESIITSKDICNLNNRETKASLAWGLRIILSSIF